MENDRGPDGRALARAYYAQVVGPLLDERWPALPHAAGRLGHGSDVLGLDDMISRDHDWGLRLSIFVDEAMTVEVRSFLDDALPTEFLGMPTRFAFTGSTDVVHHVEVESVEGFTTARLGCDPRDGMDTIDWLSLSGQAVLEVTAGPVFADRTGEIGAVRSALEWYPDDLWRHLIACDWLRIAEELPLMSRAGDLGDDLGSRIIAARLADIIIHLAFLLSRRWAPYAKWRGTLSGELPIATTIGPPLTAALRASDWRTRQHALGESLEHLLDTQRAVGLPAPAPATVPFWDRPYLVPNENVAAALRESITDPAVRAVLRGLGSAEQRTDNVQLLVDPHARRRLVGAF